MLDTGQRMNAELYRRVRAEDLARLLAQPSARAASLHRAAALLDALVLDDEFVTFLMLPAYRELA